MSYDYDGRWHDDEYRRPRALWPMIILWVSLFLGMILLVRAYDAGLLRNERPDHIAPVTTIDAPGQG
jgi:hypothetical protein